MGSPRLFGEFFILSPNKKGGLAAIFPFLYLCLLNNGSLGEERVPCFLLATNPQKTFKEVGSQNVAVRNQDMNPPQNPLKTKTILPFIFCQDK